MTKEEWKEKIPPKKYRYVYNIKVNWLSCPLHNRKDEKRKLVWMVLIIYCIDSIQKIYIYQYKMSFNSDWLYNDIEQYINCVINFSVFCLFLFLFDWSNNREKKLFSFSFFLPFFLSFSFPLCIWIPSMRFILFAQKFKILVLPIIKISALMKFVGLIERYNYKEETQLGRAPFYCQNRSI